MDPTLFDGMLVKSNRIIYTPSDFAKANLIHLQETGGLDAQKPHTSRRKNLASFLFFIVIKGEGSLEYEGTTYPLKAGDLVFVNCKKPYAHSCSEKLWCLKWVHFSGPNVGSIYEKYRERGGRPVLTVSDRTQWEELLDSIYEIAASNLSVRNLAIKDMQICEKLTSLLTLLLEQSGSNDGPEEKNGRRKVGKAKKQNLQEVKDYLDANYAKRITLDMLAETFYINKFYLTRIFKEQFGESVTGYLLQVRITRAKQLLRFSPQTIEQIAAECGMHDANYFARMFKKVEGVTPGEYRHLW